MCFSLTDTVYDYLLDTTFKDKAEALNTPCGKSEDIDTIISAFQKIYNALAVIMALLLTIYSAMNSSNITSKYRSERIKVNGQENERFFDRTSLIAFYFRK